MIKGRDLGAFIAALSLHLVLAMVLLVNFDKNITFTSRAPIVAPKAEFQAVEKPLIQATVIDEQALKQEVLRIQKVKAQEIAKEKARLQEIVRKEQELQEKHVQEEKRLETLKKENELLLQQAQAQKLEQEKNLALNEKKLQEQQSALAQKEKELAAKASALAAAKVAQKAAPAVKKPETKGQSSENKAPDAAEQVLQAQIKQRQIDRYAQLIQSRIHQFWRQPIGVDSRGLLCKLNVRLNPSGEVLEVLLLQSSGNVEFDRSAELAYYKASPLPLPQDVKIAQEFYSFTSTFRPEEL